jgi:membrane fusion protein (multidrug efflux system)
VRTPDRYLLCFVAPRVAALLVLAAACQKAAPTPPPPPEVSVATLAPQTVPARYEWVGQVEASKRVEVRSQVTGVIVDRPYVEGTDVKKGTVLFRIDPTTYEAAYRSAQAQLAQARAQLGNAERNLTRLRPLLAERAVAKKDVDDAETEAQQARAAVQDAQAAVDRAKKDYDNTFVRAEITGRAGRALMVLGALVSGPSDLLTTVEQVDPIYVNFSPSDQFVLRWRRDIASKRLVVPPGVLNVQATLADGSIFGYAGKLNFIDLALQPSTGALQLRAEFRNPKHTLLPGQFVRVHPLGLQRTGAILVPQRAVQQGLSGAFVYVLGAGDTVSARPVVASAWQGAQWLIEDGLKPGERVIVDGVQKVAPGQTVRTVPYRSEADTTLKTDGDTAIIAPPAAAPPIRDSR